MGLVGIGPTSSGLRDRCITLSATVPIYLAWRESNPRPASYKDAALTTELHAEILRSVGFEPTPAWLKARDAAITPRPHLRSGVCVSIDVASFHSPRVRNQIAREGVEPSFPPYQSGVLNH